MAFALYINAHSLRLDLRDVQRGCVVWTSFVSSSCKHGDGYDLDVAHFNQVRLASTTISSWLLEALSESIRRPVLLRLDALTLPSGISNVLIADLLREVIAQGV